jgi:putative Mg2+ transporter-C (MgtC) family protein
MQWIAEYAEPMLRLALASALGGIIGLERERAGKPAGFRTNLLICLGAALITELSIEIAGDATLPGGFRSDPGRIAAQIVSGIGFLGAGTILQSRGSIKGLTTAATMWVVAAIGMAAGAGAYVHALVGTGLVLLALMILGRFEDRVLRHDADRRFRVVLEPGTDLVLELEAFLTSAGLSIEGLDVERREDSLVASFSASGPVGQMDAVVRRLLDQPGVRRVSLF